MKKTFTFFVSMVCVAALSFAQKAPIDFETGGNGGSNFTWEVSDNGSNPALEVVSNPNKTAPNTSGMVAKFTALKDGQNWALCFTDSIGSFTFTKDNSTVKIMVHKTVKSDVALKFEVPGGINKEIKVKNTKVNEWEELEFDFSSSIGNTYSRLVIIPDFVEPYVTGKDRTADNVIYFDNITFSNGNALAEPTMAAADPTYKEEDVISMFSGVYTDVTVETWRTTWSQGTLTDVKVDGNDVKKYSDLNFVGIEPGTANLIDASGMEHINLDVWSPNSTEFKIKLVDFGADGAFQGGDDTEHELVFSAPKTEEWVNYHIPLSDFTGMTSREHIAQMIFVSAPTGTSVIYVDNVFFSKEAKLAEPTMAAADPTYKEEDVISMFSGVYTDVTVETWRTSWSEGTLTDVKVDGNDVKKYSDLNFVGIEPGTANLIDASGMEHINLDVWSPNSTEFKIKLVDFGADAAFGGGDDTEHELVFSAPKTEEWVNYHIPLSDFTGMTSREHIAQMILVSAPTGTSVIYVDNVFFSKEANSSVSESDFNRLNIYPNPASSTLNLDLEMNSGSVLGYTITDLNGKVLSNGTAAQASVDVSTWVSGVYFVNVETTKGSYAQKVLIK